MMGPRVSGPKSDGGGVYVARWATHPLNPFHRIYPLISFIFLCVRLHDGYYVAYKPIWWRTTPVATKTRYHGAGGALLHARIYPLIFISLFLYYELFDPHMFKRVLAYFPLPFRLSGGFFPFRDPIREALSFVNLCFL